MAHCAALRCAAPRGFLYTYRCVCICIYIYIYIYILRRSFCRRRSCAFTEVARLVHSSSCMQHVCRGVWSSRWSMSKLAVRHVCLEAIFRRELGDARALLSSRLACVRNQIQSPRLCQSQFKRLFNPKR